MALSPSLQCIGGILAVLVIFTTICAFGWLWRKSGELNRDQKTIVIAFLGVVLLVFGVRLYLADERVSWAPYLDQWYSEIGGIVAPFAHGTLNWRDLIAANNEHRVVLTRAVSLAAMLLNGEWDNRVTITVTLLLQSVTAAWLCSLGWCFLGWRRGTWVALASLLPMVLVCDWENIVSGFQVVFSFMILGTVVAFALFEIPVITAYAGWGALTVCALLLGSMGSGFLTAFTIALLGLAHWQLNGRKSGLYGGISLGALIIVSIGIITRAGDPAPGLAAVNLRVFWSAFLTYASWPMPGQLLGFLFLWTPWLLLGWQTWRARKCHSGSSFVLALGLWILLQSAALGWSRAGLSGLVSSRYTEVLSLGLVANTFAFLLLLDRCPQQSLLRTLRIVLPLWIACLGGMQLWRSQTIYRNFFVSFRQQTLEQEFRLRHFAKHGDERAITEVSFPYIPCEADVLLFLMRDQKVRPFLPAPLRREFPPDPQTGSGPSVEAGPLTRFAIWALGHGPWISVSGAAILLCTVLGGGGWFSPKKTQHSGGVQK